MDQINTTTHRQYVDKPGQEGWKERYKIISVAENELYISLVYVEEDVIENRYETSHRGPNYSEQIAEPELPADHIEELSDVKDRLSSRESVSSEQEIGKVKT